MLAALSQFLSLFIPLGSWYAQIIVIIPFLICLKNKSITLTISGCYGKWKKVSLSVKILTVTAVLLILTISSWVVSHPDSIGYHIQIIKWIHSYRIIPGLANLNPRLGFQSAWFTLNALFTFPFIKAGIYTYLGSVVCIWYIVCIASLINRNINKGNFALAIFWAGLLTISFWSYTQIRLTASSASPDFIAAIFILITIYLSFAKKNIPDDLSISLQVIFSFTALSIKLSAIPVCLLGIYNLARLPGQRKMRNNIVLILLSFVIFCNSITRNIITSGYIFYPSPFPDIVHADWKIPRHKAARETKYITAFAKTESEQGDKDIKETLDMQFYQWMPIWWSHRSTADKFILALLLASVCTALLLIKSPTARMYRLSFIVTTSGLIFWYILGPDPRFGWGFIISFIGISVWLLYKKRSPQQYPGTKSYKLILNIVNAMLISYTIYRYVYFFSVSQIIFPAGTTPRPFTSKFCDSIQFNVALPPYGCGDNDIPCIEGSCTEFLFRGKELTDGFKPNEPNP